MSIRNNKVMILNLQNNFTYTIVIGLYEKLIKKYLKTIHIDNIIIILYNNIL